MKLQYEGTNSILPKKGEFSLDILPSIRIDNDSRCISFFFAWLLWGIEIYFHKDKEIK